MQRNCGYPIFCVSIWRCFCEQNNEFESKDSQYRKTEEYPGTGHFADHRGTTQQFTAVSGILHNIEENQET